MLTPEIEFRLDELLRGLGVFQRAKEVLLPSVLPIDFVLAKKYLKSFPQHSLEARGALEGKSKYLLSPTCCYPVFHRFEGATFASDVIITNKSTCFRNEVEYVEGIRQISFRMREYVLFARELNSVKNWIEGVKEEVRSALESLGVSVSVMKAADPFFNPQDFQQLLQSSEDLKNEFVHNGVSLGSINLHLKAFSKSCSLRNEQGGHIYTACFGLGYDRVCWAMGSSSGAGL